MKRNHARAGCAGRISICARAEFSASQVSLRVGILGEVDQRTPLRSVVVGRCPAWQAVHVRFRFPRRQIRFQTELLPIRGNVQARQLCPNAPASFPPRKAYDVYERGHFDYKQVTVLRGASWA